MLFSVETAPRGGYTPLLLHFAPTESQTTGNLTGQSPFKFCLPFANIQTVKHLIFLGLISDIQLLCQVKLSFACTFAEADNEI